MLLLSYASTRGGNDLGAMVLWLRLLWKVFMDGLTYGLETGCYENRPYGVTVPRDPAPGLWISRQEQGHMLYHHHRYHHLYKLTRVYREAFMQNDA